MFICLYAEKGSLYTCDFEYGFCDLEQDDADQMDWLRTSGRTSSMETGPNSGALGSNFYAYIEGSDVGEGAVAR